MPNLFNQHLHDLRQMAFTHGLSSLSEQDRLDMITRPAVRRYPDEPERCLDYPCEVQVGTIRRAFGGDAEPVECSDEDEDTELYPCG